MADSPELSEYEQQIVDRAESGDLRGLDAQAVHTLAVLRGRGVLTVERGGPGEQDAWSVVKQEKPKRRRRSK